MKRIYIEKECIFIVYIYSKSLVGSLPTFLKPVSLFKVFLVQKKLIDNRKKSDWEFYCFFLSV